MIPAADGTWIYFDYVPEESNVRAGKPDVTSKICVIGSKLKEAELENLFRKLIEYSGKHSVIKNKKRRTV